MYIFCKVPVYFLHAEFDLRNPVDGDAPDRDCVHTVGGPKPLPPQVIHGDDDGSGGDDGSGDGDDYADGDDDADDDDEDDDDDDDDDQVTICQRTMHYTYMKPKSSYAFGFGFGTVLPVKQYYPFGVEKSIKIYEKKYIFLNLE